ncbi:hypothetical protein ABIF30_006575 [Bradyrhizobium elkanii]
MSQTSARGRFSKTKQPVAKTRIILLVPPECDVNRETKSFMKVNGYTELEEIEPRAGCRRFAPK